MIKWLWNNMVRLVWDFKHNRGIQECEAIQVDVGRHGIDFDNAIRLAVLPGQGGCVVETRLLDRKNHQSTTTVNIIPDSEDVAHRVGQIVAMELMRR